MLSLFRKAKKASVILITVLLLLPVQQSFSSSLNQSGSVDNSKANNSSLDNTKNNSKTTNSNKTVGMNKCNTLIDAMISSFQRFGRLDTNSNNTQASSCCDDSSCDSSHCSFSISFVAFLSNSELETSFEPPIHIPAVEQRKIRVIASELFRPPRKIQS